MAKEELLSIDGIVTESLPNGTFKIDVAGNTVIAYLSGKMRKNRIRVLEGDRVSLEVSAYDLGKGRINYRHK